MGGGTIGTPDAFKTEVERRIEVLEARVARLEHPGSHDAHVDELWTDAFSYFFGLVIGTFNFFKTVQWNRHNTVDIRYTFAG